MFYRAFRALISLTLRLFFRVEPPVDPLLDGARLSGHLGQAAGDLALLLDQAGQRGVACRPAAQRDKRGDGEDRDDKNCDKGKIGGGHGGIPGRTIAGRLTAARAPPTYPSWLCSRSSSPPIRASRSRQGRSGASMRGCGG